MDRGAAVQISWKIGGCWGAVAISSKKMKFNVLDSQNLLTEVLFEPVCNLLESPSPKRDTSHKTQ